MGSAYSRGKFGHVRHTEMLMNLSSLQDFLSVGASLPAAANC